MALRGTAARPGLPRDPCKKVAVAVSTMAIAAAGGGITATAAQAEDEVLGATATTFTGGGSGLCLKGSGSATFNAAGSATGPYPGTFTETNANASVSVNNLIPSSTLKLSVPFAISSHSTTITGMVTNPPPYSGGALECGGGSFNVAGVLVNPSAATYTATIQATGQPARTVSGTAHVSAAFIFPPRCCTTPPTVTLLNLASPPVVSTVSPNSGPTGGGTPITVTGSGFVAGDKVVIGQGGGWAVGAVAATAVNVVSSTKITAKTGGGAKPGTWNLFVVAADGTASPVVSGDKFTYTAPA
jgi:IPT/TIG domain